ncbi:type VI secretion system tube protein Hcp [bacterium]|nr:type VI secretion system tube protein Hcp [bacterium]
MSEIRVSGAKVENKAVRTFLKIDGMKGPSSYLGEEGSIELLGWDHAFNQPTQLARSAGNTASAGKAKHAPMTVLKQIDSTTTELLKKCWSGKQIDTMTISSYNADVRYLYVELKKVVVKDQRLSDSPSQIVPLEELVLDYGAVKYSYTPVDATGAGTGELPVAMDLETGNIS